MHLTRVEPDAKTYEVRRKAQTDVNEKIDGVSEGFHWPLLERRLSEQLFGEVGIY